MRIVIFTGTKLLYGQDWLLNELDILKKNKISFLLPYVALQKREDPRKTFKKYENSFFYIPRLRLIYQDIYLILRSQIRILFLYPKQYLELLVTVLTHFSWDMVKNFLKLIKNIKIIENYNPDLIYAHFTGDPYIFAFLAGKFFKKKFGFVSHSAMKDTRITPLIHSLADFIVLKAISLKRHYLIRWPRINPKKIHIIPWGIDIKYFQPLVNSSHIHNKAFTILSISRFVEMKGIIYLLNVCKLLKDQNINYYCLLVGYGPLKRKYLHFIRKNKLNKFIKILPAISHSVKFKKILSSGDLFVLPAIVAKTEEQDVLPNAVLEAMAMEKVVITTKVTGMQEVTKDGESIIFCKEKDPEDLAEKIKMVMDMPEEKRREIGRKAREIVVSKFDKWKQGEKFVRFLKKQVGEYEE